MMTRKGNVALRRAVRNMIGQLERALLRHSIRFEELKTKHREIEAREEAHGYAIQANIEQHRKQLAELEE